MFYTQKSENNLIDFLANTSVLIECATEQQRELFFDEMDTRQLKVINRFLGQRAAFSSRIPSSNSRDQGNYPEA